jgi:hypothetical protein
MKKVVKLCLHTGGEETSLALVKAVHTPAPTKTYFPIPHADFIGQVKSGLQNANLEIVNETHALAKEGKRYFGLLQVAKAGMTADDYSLVVGLRNTHDKVFPAGIVAGAGVFVCDNLSFSGEVDEFRKHTLNIFRDLPAKITQAVASLNDLWVSQETRFEAYKSTPLLKSGAVNDILVRAWKAGAMPITYLPHVFNEWSTPTHEEFRNRNVWSLFNAFTEKLKDTNLAELPERTLALHLLLDEICGIVVAPKKVN